MIVTVCAAEYMGKQSEWPSRNDCDSMPSLDVVCPYGLGQHVSADHCREHAKAREDISCTVYNDGIGAMGESHCVLPFRSVLGFRCIFLGSMYGNLLSSRGAA